MGSVLGKNVVLSVFGESHGQCVGGCLDGFPAGVNIDTGYISQMLARRSPAGKDYATKRADSDDFKLLSGVLDGKTTGAPLAFMVENLDTRSRDYNPDLLRPNHADFTARVRYNSHSDLYGGGHFSARLTTALVIAGALCGLALQKFNIEINAHIAHIGHIKDTAYDPVSHCAPENAAGFETLCPQAAEAMRGLIADTLAAGDSIGGAVECKISHLPAGLGSPMFDTVEGVLAKAIFAVPAVKAVQFGAGTDFSAMTGSAANDPFVIQDGKIKTKTNNCGGILGGITSGMPVLLTAHFKPTPTIALAQETVDVSDMQPKTLAAKGRHDPCVVPRAVVVVESVCAASILDLILEAYGYDGFR